MFRFFFSLRKGGKYCVFQFSFHMSLFNFPINIMVWILSQRLHRLIEKTINCSNSGDMAFELKVMTVMNEAMGFFTLLLGLMSSTEVEI